MKRRETLGQIEFDALLRLLSQDRDEAGAKYLHIRAALEEYFRRRGCTDVPDLIDETFDRVASRTERYDPAYGTPEKFIFGFAMLIAKEHRRKQGRLVSITDFETVMEAAPDNAEEAAAQEFSIDAMQQCLARLAPEDRELFTAYFSMQGQGRIKLRREMGERLNLTPSALYARICRLRLRLRSCVEQRSKNGM